MYGLRQSRRLWNQNVIAFFKNIGFVQLNGDPSIFIRRSRDETSIISVYVDNFLLVSNTMAILKVLKKSLSKEYDTKDLGEVKIIIGWQISRDTAAETMKINQSAFIRDLVIKESLTNCNVNIIPMKAGLAINMPDADDYKETELLKYQRLIGKLMYLVCGTRPNIAFAVRQLGKHNADPKKGHLKAVKRVVRYLKGIMQMGLIFGQTLINPPPYDLTGYADSNFVGNPAD